MIDVHTHTLLSDGDLLPEELIRRCEAAGYRALGLTDQADVVAALKRTCEAYRGTVPMRLLAGVEVTHVHPRLIARAVALARDCGAELVLGHGETLVEPVAPGSNRAFIEAGVDILAHPGLISEAEVALAAERGVRLEISGRKGHCLANGHVAALARRLGARLSFGSDSHGPSDLCPRENAVRILRGAGLEAAEAEGILADMERLFTEAAGGPAERGQPA